MRIALYQARTGLDPAANARDLTEAVRAAAAGARRPCSHRNVRPARPGSRPRGRPPAQRGGGPGARGSARAAAEAGIWVHLGSLALTGESADGRLVNRGFLIDAAGQVRARYDKIHLFDVDLPTGESWRDSAAYAPGTQPMVAETPAGRLGLSICYDLRFPDLYRTLSDFGATLLAVPAAFTVPTGQAHWHVLLRARAIEAGAFVIAAAQCGRHEDGRETMAIRWWSIPGGACCSTWAARRSASDWPTSIWRRWRKCGPAARDPPPPPDSRAAPVVIVFDLRCEGSGHVFEAWFGSSSDYEQQRARQLIQCPICGDGEIGKAVMAPRLASGSGQADAQPMMSAPEAKQLLAAMAAMQKRLLSGSEHVGRRFADEARAIHLGEVEKRSIHGEATRAEAEALREEGVAVAPLPFPTVKPCQEN
jgi:predicted amidohydrolase